MELSVTMHDFCTGACSKANKYIDFDHNLLDLGKKKKNINMMGRSLVATMILLATMLARNLTKGYIC